jgi:chromosome segregation ATPase
VGRVLRFLVRLIFVLIIGALIGAGLFYGIPWVYQRLVWPVQENSARVAILEEQVAKNSENIFDNHLALQDRVIDLENEIAELKERAAAQAQDQEVLGEESQQLAERIATLEEDLATQLETQQEDIEQVRSDVTDATADLQQEIERIREQLEEVREETGQRIEVSEEGLNELEGQLDAVVTDFRARLSLLQTAQDLVKVRLLLVEDNPGAARDTLDLAVAHLNQAAELIPSQAEVLDDLRQRMLSLGDLIDERSFRARPSLEALWADVMDLAGPLTAQSTVTETEVTSPLPTPTPSP